MIGYSVKHNKKAVVYWLLISRGLRKDLSLARFDKTIEECQYLTGHTVFGHMIVKMGSEQEGLAGSLSESSENTPLLNGNQEDELTGCGGSLACNPKRGLHRYLVLIFMCLLSFGENCCMMMMMIMMMMICFDLLYFFFFFIIYYYFIIITYCVKAII